MPTQIANTLSRSKPKGEGRQARDRSAVGAASPDFSLIEQRIAGAGQSAKRELRLKQSPRSEAPIADNQYEHRAPASGLLPVARRRSHSRVDARVPEPRAARP